jgi:hypothetical protein
MIIKTTKHGTDTIELVTHEDGRIVMIIEEFNGKRRTLIELSGDAASLLVLELRIAIRETKGRRRYT